MRRTRTSTSGIRIAALRDDAQASTSGTLAGGRSKPAKASTVAGKAVSAPVTNSELVTDVRPDAGPDGTYQVGIDFNSWLQSTKEELEVPGLRIEGKIPAWLRGSLIHAGPAKFEFGKDEFVDWVDGQAMLYKVQIRDGDCTYHNRWLDTWNHRNHREAGKIAVRETCSRPSIDGFFDRFKALIRPPNNENANLHISQIAGGTRSLSMSVGSAILEFNPSDLSTYGKVPYDDELAEGGPLIFHTEPHCDTETGEWYTCAIQLLPDIPNGKWKPEYVVFSIPGDVSQEPGTPIKRNLITRIKSEYPAPIHTMALTPRYMVLIQIPYPLNWDGMMAAEFKWLMTGHYEGNLNDYNTWEPSRPTLLRVIDRKTGEEKKVFESDAMFFFHNVNSFEDVTEDGHEVVYVDVVSYTEPPVGFPLRQARSGDVEDWRGGGGDVRRYKLDMETGECTWTGWPDNCFDEPKINPKVDGIKHRYSWGVQDDCGTLRLVKLDHDTHEVIYWDGQDVSRELPWQPVFVPEPYNDREDAGVVLSFNRDQPTGDSCCVIIDSATMKEEARIHFPKGHHIALHGHGMWMQGVH